MNRPVLCSLLLSTMVCCTLPTFAQQQTSASVIVPRLIRFGGVLKDASGKPLQGVAGLTFALYKNQEGGAALWLETQNVTVDASGHYSVLLGATKEEGVPVDLFTSGAAQWLGIQVQGQSEQPRVWMVSVPYALKAGDADTVGGLPPSAFVLAVPAEGGVMGEANLSSNSTTAGTATIGGSGITNDIPIWTGSATLGNSVMSQVGGNVRVAGGFQMPSTGTAVAGSTGGKNSQAFELFGSTFNSTLAVPVPQHFRLQEEPVGQSTASPSGKVSLLYAPGSAALAETGFSINSKGLITFAPGQTLPGITVTGNETVSGNLTATQLISTVATGRPPLKVTSTTQVPNLNASLLGGMAASAFATLRSNNFVGNESVTGNVGVSGSVGVGTTTPATILDVTTSAGNHAPMAQFGSKGSTDSNSIRTYNGSGMTEIFNAGCASCFVPGASAGDGGLRVAPGAKIFLGDEFTDRVSIDSDGTLNSNFFIDARGGGGEAIGAFNDSGSLLSPALIAENGSSTSGVPVFETVGGTFGIGTGIHSCTIDVNATITCDGTTITAPTLSSGRTIAFYGVAAAENLFEDFGVGQLSGGVATVALDPTFVDAVNTGIGYHVYLTPNSDCKGLYVAQKTPTWFEVHELGGGSSNVAFDYRIVAHRKGYEKVRLEDRTEMMKAAAANVARFRRKPAAPTNSRVPATK